MTAGDKIDHFVCGFFFFPILKNCVNIAKHCKAFDTSEFSQKCPSWKLPM